MYDFHIEFTAAGKNIYGCKIMFRPGVDCDVGFSDDDYTTNPMRIKLVKRIRDDRGIAIFSGMDKCFPDLLRVVKFAGFTIVIFSQQVIA